MWGEIKYGCGIMVKYCTNCGKENHESSVFCENCGENFNKKQYNENQSIGFNNQIPQQNMPPVFIPERKSNTNTIILILVLVFIVIPIILFIIGFIIIQSSTPYYY